MASRHGACPGATPGDRTNFKIRRAPACAAESPKLRLPGAAPGRRANQFMGPWLKSEAPALQAVPSGSVTRRTPPFRIAGNSTKHRAKPHKLRQAGVIPAPATHIYKGSDPARDL
jgi:hypothetical protein